MRPLNEIIVHCSATPPDWRGTQPLNFKVAEIRRWHVEDRGWSDIGYHYIIDRDGKVADGRPLDRVGAHVQGHNTGTVGVCLLGGAGSSATDAFEDNFTPEQDRALRALIAQLQAKYPSIMKVSGHNQYAAKACPGFDAPRWHARQAPRTATESTTIRASAGQVVSGAGAVVGGVAALEGPAQIAAIVIGGLVVALALWIMRERLLKRARGVL